MDSQQHYLQQNREKQMYLKMNLMNRLYDKGISFGTMPSVKRPNSENMRPYTARVPAHQNPGSTLEGAEELEFLKSGPMNKFKDITEQLEKSSTILNPIPPIPGRNKQPSTATPHLHLRSSEIKAKKLKTSSSQANLKSARLPLIQYGTYEKKKYARPRTSLLGVHNYLQKDPSKKTIMPSSSVKSITGIQTMTSLGPISQRKMRKDILTTKRIIKRPLHKKKKSMTSLHNIEDLNLLSGKEGIPTTTGLGETMKCYNVEELKRSQELMHKITGREYIYGPTHSLPPLPEAYLKEKAFTQTAPLQHMLTKYAEPDLQIAEEIDAEEEHSIQQRDRQSLYASIPNQTLPPLDLKQYSSMGGEGVSLSKWKELDIFINMLQNSTEDQGEFIYVVERKNSHPYDLVRFPYKQISHLQNSGDIKINKYHTLSKKGVTTYINNEPVEFVTLTDWLVERDQFQSLSQFKFFKRFRKWKCLNMWRRNVISCKRRECKKILEEKLFHADKYLGPVLREHKIRCNEMEKLKFYDLSSGRMGIDIQHIEEFANSQRVRREEVLKKRIQDISAMTRENFKKAIAKIMENVKKGIKEEILKESEDLNKGKKGKNNMPNIGEVKTESKKVLAIDSVYENLGFPQKMSYGQRSELRKQCSRFIRFSYLLDFIALDALKNIYINSYEDLRRHVQKLNDIQVAFELQKIKPLKFGEVVPQRNKDQPDPLFAIEVEFTPEEIDENNIRTEMIEEFKPSPMGKVELDKFDPSCHLIEYPSLDTKFPTSPRSPISNKSVESQNQIQPIRLLPRHSVERLDKLWLNISPRMNEVFEVLMESLREGFNVLKNFERWSKHEDLTLYARVLEEWDDKVATEWEVADENFLNCEEWLAEEKYYGEKEQEEMDELLRNAYDKNEKFLRLLHDYLHIYWKHLQIPFEMVENERLANPVEIIQSMLKSFTNQKEDFQEYLPEMIDTGLFRVDFRNLRKALLSRPADSIKEIETRLPAFLREQCNRVKKWILKWTTAIQEEVDTVDKFVAQADAIRYIKDNIQVYSDKIDLLRMLYILCQEYKLELPKGESEKEASQLLRVLNLAMYDAEDLAEKNKDSFKIELNQLINVLNEDVNKFLDDVNDKRFLDIDSDLYEMLHLADSLDEQFKNIEMRSRKYNISQECLDLLPTSFTKVEDAKIEIQIRGDLWRALHDWKELVEQWINNVFCEIDTDQITTQADFYTRIVTKSENYLPRGSSSVQELKDLVFEFKETMPIVIALGNKYLEQIHWDDIKRLLNLKEDFEMEKKEFTLGTLIQLNIVNYQEQIQNISTTASQERMLTDQLTLIENQWNIKKFNVQPKEIGTTKDTYAITEFEDLFVDLDEALASMNNIIGSRYVKRLQKRADEMKSKLDILQDTTEEWKLCQQNWIYLANIFLSKDIRDNVKSVFQSFEKIDKNWRITMRKVNQKPGVLGYATKKFLQEIKKYNKEMDKIQKDLEAYLESKRKDFPRFYFLSNDELLQILAHSNSIHAGEQHLNKCFDNIAKFELIPDQQNPTGISAMISAEGEVIKLIRDIKLRSQDGIVIWLQEVEKQMVLTLQRNIKVGLNEYYANEGERKDWVLSHSAQIVSVVANIIWTESCEYFINEMQENINALIELYESAVTQLMQLTELITGQLSPVERKMLVSLITSDVHWRDISEQLTIKSTTSTKDFIWQQQLRYSMEDIGESDPIVRLRQINAILNYGYEYMGPTSRLVITPLTDRCWITITGALHIHLGANPAGPAGTGKTESTKDLAKGIAIFCVVFNCSEQINYKIMARLFSGLVQCGCWSCLDEFNRIDIEVLSVIAQQLLLIRFALLKGDLDFAFNGVPDMKILGSCGVFVTMNPGYAGRTELPDNLKVLFRPVAMMIPDYTLIAEIMLFAEGFSNAKPLSKKMTQLYKLASEQLSQQDHYDFGMRAVKSVLVMAGALKRAEPEVLEDIVLIRAMRDSNIPKFLADDAPLFKALIQDLFPGSKIPAIDYGELSEQIEDSLGKLNLQPVPEFILKVRQLFDTILIRFGVMVVGPTGGGKTASLKVLEHAMTSLRESGSSDARFQKVTSKKLNPKSISLGELYGEENSETREWTDGLASLLMRKAAKKQTHNKNWIIFDGPVDSLWIENLNTVLDDNMTLCLSNGERVKLRHEMRILFEVQDLSEASPATVSRCGMVYMTPSDLGWEPFIQSWIPAKFSDENILDKELIAYLQNLIQDSVEKGIKLLRKLKDYEPIKTCGIQCVSNLCNMLEYYLSPHFGFKKSVSFETKRKRLLTFFCFAYAWSFGGSLNTAAHIQFDDLVRPSFNKVQIPMSETVFEYYVEMIDNGIKIVPWSKKVPQFTYQKELPFFQILVPTIDTVRYSKMLEILIQTQKATFFTGITGVGKSVIIQNLIAKNQESHNLTLVFMNFSAQTSSHQTQQTLEAKFEKKRGKKLVGAPGQNKLVIFVDDVNMPLKEIFGAQPPIELLRQLIDSHGFYNRPKFFWKTVEKETLICAAAPPGGGRSELTPRFMRHFHVFCLPQPSEDILRTIFEAILMGFLSENKFQDAVIKLGTIAVASTVEIYCKISTELRPTPSKFHYLFNLRDVSKVFQGILMTKNKSIHTAELFTHLWIHEVSRVFADRLIDQNDILWLNNLIVKLVSNKFRYSWTYEDLFLKKKIVFTDLLTLSHEKVYYQQVNDMKKLANTLENILIDFNLASNAKMDLVFFDDAIYHVCRIARILNQPRGNAMVIGVGGSGKFSLTRLASFVLNFKFEQVKLTKSFKIKDFREFIKGLMYTSGQEGQSLTFLMTDTQIINEIFLEDINNILNTGEITNLFNSEEIELLIGEMRDYDIELGRTGTKDSVYSTFVDRVRDKLHIVLCMSPVGDNLRSRCRKFPSLVNCCTLDYFHQWPLSALLSVSQNLVRQLSFIDNTQQQGLSTLFPYVHTSVEKMALKFFDELRRKVYITPKSYLDSIKFFTESVEEKRKETRNNLNTLASGLKKLRATEIQVAELKEILIQLQPELQEQNKKAQEALERNKEEAKIAGAEEREVEKETARVEQQGIQIKYVRDDAQQELDKAMPELEAAQEGLKNLKKEDITMLKSYINPPKCVALTMQAVLILLEHTDTTWKEAMRVLSDIKFLEKLKEYNADDIKVSVLKKLGGVIHLKEFDPDDIYDKCRPAKSLACWAIAVSKYSEALKKVIPKKQKLLIYEEKFQVAHQELMKKQKELEKMKAILAQYEAEYAKMMENIAALTDKIEATSKRHQNAEKLIELLADEGIRWNQQMGILTSEEKELVGNVFLSAISICYIGPFNGSYRDALIQEWRNQCTNQNILTSENYSLIHTIGNAVTIKNWNICGLPTDIVSTENGIIATKTKRWPLMIDPQGQANKWVRLMEKENKLRVIKFSEGDDYIKVLDNSIQIGVPVLLEDTQTKIDPALEPILGKKTFKNEGLLQIRFSDRDIAYDPNFSLYLTTKIANPHFLPDICILLTIINFTVTFDGLEEQLLGDVIVLERPEVEEEREKLIYEIASYQKQLKEISKKILDLLAETKEETILDDIKLIETLESSKVKSTVIGEKMSEATQIEEKINISRNEYKNVSIRGAIIYFVIADLGQIDPMYQYSLTYVKNLINEAIKQTTETESDEQRIEALINNITQFVYRNICRGLFEAHKLTFSFLICTSIKRYEKEISQEAWNLLLSGAGLYSKEDQPKNPIPALLKKASWDLVCLLEEAIPQYFLALPEHITKNSKQWKSYAFSKQPENAKLPEDFEKLLPSFERLLILKIFRPEKLLFACTNYVQKELGAEYTVSPSVSMESLFADSDWKTPIIFVLSQGADPTTQLFKFAEENEMEENLKYISLGQGQGSKAEEMIKLAKLRGTWILLQNCHLAKSFMPRLESLILKTAEEEKIIKPSYRLFLTSMPADYFPVSILQNGLKSTTEPPAGIKSNLKRIYGDLSQGRLDTCPGKDEPWRKLLFSLSFFHAVVQERRKFGPLGWNIRYHFNDSDLETSITMLKNFILEQEEIPWDALTYSTGQINYGGRVTDDWDRKLLLMILQTFYTEDVLQSGYKFSQSGVYFSPDLQTVEEYREYIESLPNHENPEIFGMHENASITYQRQESDKMLFTVLQIQPKIQAKSSDGVSSDDLVLQVAADLREKQPMLIEPREKAHKNLFKPNDNGIISSLATVLIQEAERFNTLLFEMNKSLINLELAIKGYAIMSPQLDDMYTCFLKNQVPPNWMNVGYPSLKKLGSWVRDLYARVAFIRNWLLTGQPYCFWLSGFFFPQGFLTGALQTHARRYRIPIDQLAFEFKVLKQMKAKQFKSAPKDGIIIYGLFLQAAAWDFEKQLLCEQAPGEMFSKMPLIHFNPIHNYAKNEKDYNCPVYKTTVRAGVLSSLGQSTNFVLAVDLETEDDPEKWILKGTALFCQLDD